jgi:hypothetical protein
MEEYAFGLKQKTHLATQEEKTDSLLSVIDGCFGEFLVKACLLPTFLSMLKKEYL